MLRKDQWIIERHENAERRSSCPGPAWRELREERKSNGYQRNRRKNMILWRKWLYEGRINNDKKKEMRNTQNPATAVMQRHMVEIQLITFRHNYRKHLPTWLPIASLSSCPSRHDGKWGFPDDVILTKEFPIRALHCVRLRSHLLESSVLMNHPQPIWLD